MDTLFFEKKMKKDSREARVEARNGLEGKSTRSKPNTATKKKGYIPW